MTFWLMIVAALACVAQMKGTITFDTALLTYILLAVLWSGRGRE